MAPLRTALGISCLMLICSACALEDARVAAPPVTNSKASPRPNVLLLVAEDLSPRLGAYGDRVAQTPNLDALAGRSVRFTNVFTTAGVCAPSRAALITGLHQISFGAQHMRASTGPLGEYYAQPPSDVRAFPELLRAAGYFTFTDSKLDYQFSGIRAGSGPFTIWDIDGAGDTAWRQRAQDQPFFGMINFLETHESGVMRPDGPAHSESHRATQRMRASAGLMAPKVTAPAVIELPPYYPDVPEVRRDIARHYDNIAAMDARVGRILEALRQDGLANDTVVIWTSDHGDGLPRAKRELYDSGIHVPLLLHHPGDAQNAGTVDERLVSFVDLAPTILELAGVAPPAYLHGRSMLTAAPREYVFASRDRIDEVPDRQRAVRDARYKYIKSYRADLAAGHPLDYRDNLDMVRIWRTLFEDGELTGLQARWFQPQGAERLFDTQTDPHEIDNLAGKVSHAAHLQRLRRALERFQTRVGDTSETPEASLRAQYLDNGRVPVTPAPMLCRHDLRGDGDPPRIGVTGTVSVGVRAAGTAERWRLMTDPVTLDTPQGLEFRAVRYGWRPSNVIKIVNNSDLPRCAPPE